MFISDRAQRQWIQERIEPTRAAPKVSPDEQVRLLQKLTEAEHLERYLHTRYVGQKRFSLEGGESLIPAIDELIQRAGANGVQEIVIGMAHRGRRSPSSSRRSMTSPKPTSTRWSTRAPMWVSTASR